MLKRFLAGLGIDSAKVNLEIDRERVRLGESISGRVIVKGGMVEQQVDEISIALIVTSQYQDDDETKGIRQEIGKVKISEKLTIEANAPEASLPVQFKIPYHIPISSGNTRYHLETSLDIKNALDPTDKDEILILPNEQVESVFDAFKRLGFRAKARSGDYNGRFQQFEFIPTQFMKGKLDEVELYLEAQEKKINLMLQIDKKSRGLFAGLIDNLDLDESHVVFSLSKEETANVEQVADILQDIIEEQYRKIDF